MTEYVLHFDAILANAGEHSTAVLLLILFFGTLVSEDLACIAAGTLAANGRIGFAESVLACFFGIFAGDLLIYWVGRVFGGRVIESRIFRRFVSEAAVRKGTNWLNERGAAAVFLSRFVVGLRLPTYVAAGILRTNFPKFTIYFAVAAAVWTPILVGSTAIWQKAVPGNIAAGAIAAFFA